MLKKVLAYIESRLPKAPSRNELRANLAKTIADGMEKDLRDNPPTANEEIIQRRTISKLRQYETEYREKDFLQSK